MQSALFAIILFLDKIVNTILVSSQSTHVFDDNRANSAILYHGDEALPVRAVKVGAGEAIVYEEHGVNETIVIGIFLQDGFLVDDGVAVALEFVITGEAAVKGSDLVRNR